MRRRQWLQSTLSAAAGTALAPSALSYAFTAKQQRVLFFTRNVGFYHSVVQRDGDGLSHAERALVAMASDVGIEVTCTKDGTVFDRSLDEFDAFAFFTNNDLTEPNPQNEPPMTARGKQRLLDAVENGKGFLGFHSTCACWRTQPAAADKSLQIDPFLRMLGGEFIAHGPQQEATLRVTSPGFPGMQRLGSSITMYEEWYSLKNFADDLHVITVQETEGMLGKCYQRPAYPSSWARMQGRGRVYFTPLAHRENLWIEQPMRQIVLGALDWILGNVDADVTPNIVDVAPKANLYSSNT